MVLTAETYNPVFWGVAFCFLVLISILSLVILNVVRSATVGILSLGAILVANIGCDYRFIYMEFFGWRYGSR